MISGSGGPAVRRSARRGLESARWAACIALTLALACDGGPAPEAPTGAVRPNVIFIAIDTVGAAHLSAYGYERETSPAMEAFARRGVLFEAAYSQASYTLPSFAATFTGTYVSNSGAPRPAFQVHSSRTTLAELLAANGYRTVGLHGGGLVSEAYGFGRGFDEYRKTSNSLEASDFTDPAIEWLEDNDDRPFFLFLHTYDAHSPYGTSPRKYRELFTDPDYEDTARLADQANWIDPFEGTVISPRDADYIRGLYDGEIRYVDDQLRGFFEYLERSGLRDTTYVFLFSDHGEEFREHEHFGHAACVHPEVVWVPLIVAGPGVPAGRRVGDITRLIDLYPTLVELLDLDTTVVKQGLDGRSFAGRLASGGEGEDGAPGGAGTAISQHLGVYSDRDQQWSLRTPDWALVRRSPWRVELYDRRADPGEHENVWREHIERAEALEAEYEAAVAANAVAGELEPVAADQRDFLRDNLRALGYIDDQLRHFQ